MATINIYNTNKEYRIIYADALEALPAEVAARSNYIKEKGKNNEQL